MAGMAPVFEGVGRPAGGTSNSVVSEGEEALLALAGGLPLGVCGAGRFWPFLLGVCGAGRFWPFLGGVVDIE